MPSEGWRGEDWVTFLLDEENIIRLDDRDERVMEASEHYENIGEIMVLGRISNQFIMIILKRRVDAL